MRASHFVLEGVSGLGLAHGELKVIASNGKVSGEERVGAGEKVIKFFESFVFVASVIKMHEIRSNLIVFTH